MLSYEYTAPPSQQRWGKGELRTAEAWLKVAENTFEGALSGATEPVIDYAVKGHRRR